MVKVSTISGRWRHRNLALGPVKVKNRSAGAESPRADVWWKDVAVTGRWSPLGTFYCSCLSLSHVWPICSTHLWSCLISPALGQLAAECVQRKSSLVRNRNNKNKVENRPQQLQQSSHCGGTLNWMECCQEPETTEHALLLFWQYTKERKSTVDGLRRLGMVDGQEKNILSDAEFRWKERCFTYLTCWSVEEDLKAAGVFQLLLKPKEEARLSTVLLVPRWPVSNSPLGNCLGLWSPTRTPAFFLCVWAVCLSAGFQ